MRPIVFFLAFSTLASAQVATTSLQAKVAGIAPDAKGTVSVSCLLPGTKLNCDLNPHAHPPMQSVFKFPIALTVLYLAETGRLFPKVPANQPLSRLLDHPVRFLPQDRIPHTYSPLQDRFPSADVDVSLRELIQLSAGRSDNAATDVLLRIAGGPSVVQAYIRSLGIQAFQLQDGEDGLDRDNSAQYRNWIEPAAAVQLLQRFARNSPLSPDATLFLNGVLLGSTTGLHRIHGDLPDGTPVAHKTGTSGTHGGITAASNDIGLITLPDGRRLAIAIFVTDAKADESTREDVIARIARAAYDEAVLTQKRPVLR